MLVEAVAANIYKDDDAGEENHSQNGQGDGYHRLGWVIHSVTKREQLADDDIRIKVCTSELGRKPNRYPKKKITFILLK